MGAAKKRREAIARGEPDPGPVGVRGSGRRGTWRRPAFWGNSRLGPADNRRDPVMLAPRLPVADIEEESRPVSVAAPDAMSALAALGALMRFGGLRRARFSAARGR